MFNQSVYTIRIAVGNTPIWFNDSHSDDFEDQVEYLIEKNYPNHEDFSVSYSSSGTNVAWAYDIDGNHLGEIKFDFEDAFNMTIHSWR